MWTLNSGKSLVSVITQKKCRIRSLTIIFLFFLESIWLKWNFLFQKSQVTHIWWWLPRCSCSLTITQANTFCRWPSPEASTSACSIALLKPKLSHPSYYLGSVPKHWRCSCEYETFDIRIQQSQMYLFSCLDQNLYEDILKANPVF